MLLPTLKTDRLRIRPLTVKDLSICHQLYLDTKWADQGLADKRNLQIRRRWLDWTIRNYTELDRLNQPPTAIARWSFERAVKWRGLIMFCLRLIGRMRLSNRRNGYIDVRRFSLSENQRAAIDRSNAEALFPRLPGGLS